MSNAMTRLRGIAEGLFTEGFLAKDDVDPLFSETTDRLLLIASAEGRCLRANDAWHTQLGHPKQVIEGSSYFELIHPDDLAATREVASGMSDQRVTNFHNRYRRSDGSYAWVSWAASQYDQAGTTYAIADVVTDPAALRELEELARERSRQTSGEA